jgi:hypothetical protein
MGQHLNNNTPVHTEVLLLCWSFLVIQKRVLLTGRATIAKRLTPSRLRSWARAKGAHKQKQVIDSDVPVAGNIFRASITRSPCAQHGENLVCVHSAVPVNISWARLRRTVDEFHMDIVDSRFYAGRFVEI